MNWLFQVPAGIISRHWILPKLFFFADIQTLFCCWTFFASYPNSISSSVHRQMSEHSVIMFLWRKCMVPSIMAIIQISTLLLCHHHDVIFLLWNAVHRCQKCLGITRYFLFPNVKQTCMFLLDRPLVSALLLSHECHIYPVFS